MRYCLVGDLHVKLDNLKESRRVIEWVAQEAKRHDATPIFMGDQFDSMSVIRAEVLEFWVWAYGYLNNTISGDATKPCTISLVGNHDINSDGTASAMSAFESVTTVVDARGLAMLDGNVGAIGFIRDNDKFAAMASAAVQMGCKYLLCHAEFNGAMYENGFYSPHGIDLEKIPNNIQYISGHIHKRQTFGTTVTGQPRIIYIGTPRQLTRSDIGEVKGICLFTPATGDGTFIQTPINVSDPYVEVNIVEGQDYDLNLPSRVYVNIHGSKEFIKKVCKELPDETKTRTFPTGDVKVSEVKESEGVPVAFGKYCRTFFNGDNATYITADEAKAVLELVYKTCPSLKAGV